MLAATVDDNLAVWLYVKFLGDNGIEMDIPLLFDTGFSEWISLPRDFLDALGFPEYTSQDVTLGDGQQIDTPIYKGRILWDGQEQEVPIHNLEGDPLLGMQQLADYLITIPARVGETVTFVQMP